MFSWSQPLTHNPAFAALHSQINKISYTTCYCSVFDECDVRDSEGSAKPRSVAQCVAPPTPFRPSFHAG